MEIISLEIKIEYCSQNEIKIKTKKEVSEKNQKRIDEILDKISQSGYESLSKEKRFSL